MIDCEFLCEADENLGSCNDLFLVVIGPRHKVFVTDCGIFTCSQLLTRKIKYITLIEKIAEVQPFSLSLY